METPDSFDQRRRKESELLKGLVRILRDAIDQDVERMNEDMSVWTRFRHQLSTDTPAERNANGDTIDGPAARNFDRFVYLRNVADQLYKFLDSPAGTSAVGLVADNWEQIVGVVHRFVILLGPVLMLFSISAMVCRYDTICHDINVSHYKKVVDDDNILIGKMRECMKKITVMIVDAWKDIDIVLRKSRWLPAEVDRIDNLLTEIEKEIVMARIYIERSEDWLEKLKQILAVYEKQMITKSVIFWIGVLVVSGGLHYFDHIDSKVATVLSAAGGIPLCHSYFSLSVDVMRMSADIRDKQRRNDQLGVNMKVYELDLSRLLARRHGRHDDGAATADDFSDN